MHSLYRRIKSTPTKDSRISPFSPLQLPTSEHSRTTSLPVQGETTSFLPRATGPMQQSKNAPRLKRSPPLLTRIRGPTRATNICDRLGLRSAQPAQPRRLTKESVGGLFKKLSKKVVARGGSALEPRMTSRVAPSPSYASPGPGEEWGYWGESLHTYKDRSHRGSHHTLPRKFSDAHYSEPAVRLLVRLRG